LSAPPVARLVLRAAGCSGDRPAACFDSAPSRSAWVFHKRAGGFSHTSRNHAMNETLQRELEAVANGEIDDPSQCLQILIEGVQSVGRAVDTMEPLDES
jgi:hypothetical protein